MADTFEIAAIHSASWRDAYADVLDATYLKGPVDEDRRAVWSDRMNSSAKAQMVLVAEQRSGELAAFLCLYRQHDLRWGSLIDNLHVLPTSRGMHIGEQLMREAASHIFSDVGAKGLYLWVFEANKAGIGFYERLGGSVVERALSEFPPAKQAPVLRMFWPDSTTLMQPK